MSPLSRRLTRREIVIGSANLSVLAVAALSGCTASAPPAPTAAPAPPAAPPAAPTALAPAAAPAASPSAAAVPAGASPAAQPAAASAPRRGGTSPMVSDADPISLDPHKGAAFAAVLAWEHTYQSLVAFDDQLNVV